MTEETIAPQPDNARDWAWDIPDKYKLGSDGILFLDLLKKAQAKTGEEDFERTGKFVVSEESNNVWSRSTTVMSCLSLDSDWTIELAQDDNTPAHYGALKVFVLTPPSKVPEDETSNIQVATEVGEGVEALSDDEQTVPDSFTAGEFAKVVANALNLYLDLSKQYFANKVTEDRENPAPFVTSWKYLQEHIVPALKEQFAKAVKEEMDKDKVPFVSDAEARRVMRNEAVYDSPFKQTPVNKKITAKMLHMLADITRDMAEEYSMN